MLTDLQTPVPTSEEKDCPKRETKVKCPFHHTARLGEMMKEDAMSARGWGVGVVLGILTGGPGGPWRPEKPR